VAVMMAVVNNRVAGSLLDNDSPAAAPCGDADCAARLGRYSAQER
jgi:hypothetical protein